VPLPHRLGLDEIRTDKNGKIVNISLSPQQGNLPERNSFLRSAFITEHDARFTHSTGPGIIIEIENPRRTSIQLHYFVGSFLGGVWAYQKLKIKTDGSLPGAKAPFGQIAKRVLDMIPIEAPQPLISSPTQAK